MTLAPTQPTRIYLPEVLPHQREVYGSPARYKLLLCGRRWGKSTLALLCCVLGHGPPDAHLPGALVDGAKVWWVARNYPQSSLVWDTLKAVLRPVWLAKSEVRRRIVLPGGGSITVRSAEDPNSLRGDGLDGVVLDEAAYMAEEVWTQALRPALSDRQGWALFATTPNGDNWIAELYEYADLRRNWARWKRPTSDNPLIPEEELEDARATLSAEEYAQEYLADIGAAQGLVYAAFDRARHVTPPPCAWEDCRYRIAGVDFGGAMPSAVCVFGVTGSGRIHQYGEFYQRRATIEEIGAYLMAWHARAPLRSVECDPSEQVSIASLRAAGLPARDAHKDRGAGIKAVQSALEHGRLTISPECENTIREYRQYRWSERTDQHTRERYETNTPADHHGDAMDATRYAVIRVVAMQSGPAPAIRVRGHW